MSASVNIKDALLSGPSVNEFRLEFVNSVVDVRELIRSRVYQEVKDFNAGVGVHFRGLVQPENSEPEQKGFRLPAHRQIDWREQFDRSIDAFSQGRVLILADERQLESLDESLDMESISEITFLRLVPLVGG